MELVIRPVRVEDAPQLNAMRRMKGVFETTLGMPSDRVCDSESFVKTLTLDDHLLVAEVGENRETGIVAGMVGLSVSPRARMRHIGSLGIMVRADYQRRGVGSALMSEILELADNWLMLKRVELLAFADNARAIAMYERFGFVSEGIKKYGAVRGGEYADLLMMARYNI